MGLYGICTEGLALYNRICTYHYKDKRSVPPIFCLSCVSSCARNWGGRRVIHIFSTPHLLLGRGRGSRDLQRHLHVKSQHNTRANNFTQFVIRFGDGDCRKDMDALVWKNPSWISKTSFSIISGCCQARMETKEVSVVGLTIFEVVNFTLIRYR